MLQVLAVEHPTAGPEGGSHDHAVVEGEPVSFGDVQSEFLRRDVLREDETSRADRVKRLSYSSPALRRATEADSFSTWMLTILPRPGRDSACSALSVSSENTWRRTLLSKKTPATLIGFEPIKLEVCRQSSAELPEPCEQSTRIALSCDLEPAISGDLDVEGIAFPSVPAPRPLPWAAAPRGCSPHLATGMANSDDMCSTRVYPVNPASPEQYPVAAAGPSGDQP